MATLKLHGYWRSSAAYRVRIALAWKHLDYERAFVDLRTGAQSKPDYLSLNSQGLVPFLEDGDFGVGQSLAIIEYLDECHPMPALLPKDPRQRARVRAMAEMIVCDIHPLNNLRVLNHLTNALGQTPAQVEHWAQKWIASGFSALEAQAHREGPYLTGADVTLADVCLVPQVHNARRVNTDLTPFPRLVAIEARLVQLPEFAAARPDLQGDAPKQ